MAEDATEAPTTAQQMGDALAAMEEDKPQSTQAPEEGAPETSEAPDYFGDNFDPSTLHESARPAYEQMRKAFTQKTQDLAEQRKQAEGASALIADLQSQDPEARNSALAWMAQNELLTEDAVTELFGLEIDQPDEEAAEEDEDDPLAKLSREFNELRNNLTSRDQAQAEEQYIAQADEHIGKELAGIAKQRGVDELPAEEQQLIVSRALVNMQPGTMPDIQSAYKELDAAWTARQQGWAASKQAPYTAAGGHEAVEAPDLDNPEQRREHMAGQLAAFMESQQT